MAGHGRSKNGVPSARLCPAIHVLGCNKKESNTWRRGSSPRMTGRDRESVRGKSLLGFSLAQQVFGKIGERWPRQGGERQRTGDLDRREPKPRREQSVENAFSEPLRQF